MWATLMGWCADYISEFAPCARFRQTARAFFGITTMRFRLLWVPGALLFLSGPAPAAEGLPPARDLAADARLAADRQMPILVFFTSASCPYCREVEDLYLRPMQARGTYRGRLLMRAVEVGGGMPLTDFTGGRMDHGLF